MIEIDDSLPYSTGGFGIILGDISCDFESLDYENPLLLLVVIRSSFELEQTALSQSYTALVFVAQGSRRLGGQCSLPEPGTANGP